MEKDKAIQVIINQFNPLIHKMVDHYVKSRKDLRDVDDFYSVARIAVVKSIQKFDMSKKIKFITFLYKGLHNELIGAYRKMVKQGTVEAVTTTKYFHKNEEGGTSAENKEDENAINPYNTRVVSEGTLSLLYDIITNIDLSIEEGIYFFSNRGIYSTKYNHREIKKMFNTSKIDLKNAERKVQTYLFTSLECNNDLSKYISS